MISDVLADTITAIDEYLDDPALADIYEDPLLNRILSLRNEMDRVRAELDASSPTPAGGRGP